MKKKLSRGKKVTFCILGILLAIIIAGVACRYFYLNNLLNKTAEIEINKENIGVAEVEEEKLSKYSDTITNIALFVVDTDQNGISRSDSIMIATIDTVHKKLKLTSIMRDSYVDIEGYGYDKMDHAYAFGGPELAINTINQNFGLNIKDFVSVNTSTLYKIIDKLGGVNIEVDSDELNYINEYIDDINRINGTSSPNISTTGVHHMDGTQAMAYCRIRYTSDGHYKILERYIEVLPVIFSDVLELKMKGYPGYSNDEILSMVETSLKSSDILDLDSEILKMGELTLEQEIFPRDGYCQGEMINGVYCLTFDKATTVEQIHNYIFEDTKTW